MAAHNPFLANWVKNAYSMELGLAPLLERQVEEVNQDPELRKGLEHHLQQTRRHAELLKTCLQRMGENVANIHAANPLSGFYSPSNGSGPDVARRTELIDYVTEHFEVASYRALGALASMAGDHETARICQQILQDEEAISHALAQRIPGTDHDGKGLAGGGDRAQTARATFDGLNTHDLHQFDQFTTAGFQAQAPGVPGTLDLDHNRSYIQAYITAFQDLHFDIERTIAAGDDVVVLWTATGTHTGPLRNPNGMAIPPTNKQVHVRGITTYTFNNNKIAQSVVHFDTGELLQQLGLMPGAEPGQAANTQSRKINYIEIPASDREHLADFYSKMFGWEIEHMPAPMDYTAFHSGNVMGGFPHSNDMYQPGDVILYVESNDIDADLRRAGTLGAKALVRTTEIPGFGWYAILSDPTGNRIGLFKTLAG
jgi:predicted enzyme related to lactoylglutathione lyase/ferritin-like metal-binding protein YciE/predicted ester cyclase